MPSHYNDPISNDPNRIGGSSRRAGDASLDTKVAVISKIITYGRQYGLSDKDVANLIAFSKIESGYNPDAAAKGGWTSASGVFQITDTSAKDAATRLNGSARVGGINAGVYDRFDVDSNIKYGILIYLDKKIRANSDDVYDIYKSWGSNPEEYTKYKNQLRLIVRNSRRILKRTRKLLGR